MKLYFDLLTTLKVIHAESPVVIFFGTYGIVLILRGRILNILKFLSTFQKASRRPRKGPVTTTTSVARGGGGGQGGNCPTIMLFRSFVGTSGNLSVHVSRQAYHLYRQNINARCHCSL